MLSVRPHATVPVVLIGLSLCLLPTSSLAVGGVLEINQSCAVTTGCFIGDSAGFPVTITGAPGSSYRLTGDLSTATRNQPGIQIETNDITLDLNGFSVIGPVTCTKNGLDVICDTLQATAYGIDASSRSGIAVENGQVRGFAGRAIEVGDQGIIRDVHVESAGDYGIWAGENSILRNSSVKLTGSVGVYVSQGSIVANVTSSSNAFYGIWAESGSLLIGNTVTDNRGDGILTFSDCSIRGNSAYDNDTSGIIGGPLVSENTSRDNAVRGFLCVGETLVQRNNASGNGMEGFQLNTTDAFRGITSNGNGASVTGGVNLGANSCNGTSSCP